MLDKNIVVSNQDIQDAVNNLNATVTEPGIVSFSKFLFSENGIILRLETSVDYVPASVEDAGKVASARAQYNTVQAQLKAKYPGLTDEQIEGQLKADDRAARIAVYTDGGVDQAEAAKLVDEEIAQEDQELEDAKAKAGFDLDEYKFHKWVDKENIDIFKEIFVIRAGKKLFINYTFDKNIVGVAGGAVLGEVSEFEPEEAITFDGLKAAFSEYVTSPKFKAGLAFISRITDVNLSVSVG